MKFRYLHTLLHGKALRKFETFCVQVGNTTMTHLNQIMLVLATCFSCQFVVQKKARDVPYNDGSVRIKIEALLFSYGRS